LCLHINWCHIFQANLPCPVWQKPYLSTLSVINTLIIKVHSQSNLIVAMFFQMGFSDTDGKPGSFAEQYTLRRETHLTSLQQKEEEMRQKFVIRVKEKESELKEAEREVRAACLLLTTDSVKTVIKLLGESN